jgi:hypothetical protein
MLMRTSYLKWGERPQITKLITFTKRGLRVFVNVVGYEKAKVHGGGSNWERQMNHNQQK